MELFINRQARDRAGLLALVNGQIMRSTAKLPLLVRNDGEPVTVRVADPSQSGVRDFDEVDISTAIVRVGIGLPDLAPTVGTFTISETTGPDLSSSLAFNATAAVVEAAVNEFPEIVDAGGVTVIKPSAGVYQITFVDPGVQTPRFTANTSRLAPLSVATVSRIQVGTVDVQEIVLIQLIQNAYVYNVLSDALPAAAATVEHIQTGGGGLTDIQRITLSPLPYGGTFDLTIASETIRNIPWNVSAVDLAALIDLGVDVEKTANNEWITENADELHDAEVDVTDLIVPTGVTGTLALNTMEIWRAFLATTAKVLTFTLEVQLQFPGESTRTIYQGPIEMSRNVLNLDTLAAATTLGLQTAYSALFGGIASTWTTAITGLTGGGTALDAVPTASLALGARYDFPLSGSLNAFVLVTGAADATDTAGQVAPLDFNAGTNNKHWQRES